MISHYMMAQGHIDEATFRNELSAGFAALYSTIDVQTTLGYKLKGEPKLGYGAELLYTKNLSRYFSLQTGFVYHSLFNNLQMPDKSQYRIHLDNIHVPFLFRLTSDECCRLSYSLFAGPQVSMNMGAEYVVIKEPKQQTAEDARDDGYQSVISINDFDAGFAYGGSVNFVLTAEKNIILNIGYLGTFGFADMCGPVESDETNIISDQSTKDTFGAFGAISFAF